jgi:hypothetical protein
MRGSTLAGIALFVALLWLLLVRGLYPGGGTDYYTHYFYYYTNVIKNHGLVPNDVWYHYYYSKGAGIHFLGILLMDAEAPSLMTFVCVAIGALALFNLISKVSTRSFWPGFCAILYVLYNLISLSGIGGEFQKTHEETTAMAILVIWAISMYDFWPKEWEKSAFIILSFLAIGAALVTQAMAVYFALIFVMQICLAYSKRNWRVAWFYFYLSAITSLAVISMLVMNYLVTGLATDQALNTAWQFANVERLDQWGILPNIIMIAWIRDNYDLVTVSWNAKNI